MASHVADCCEPPLATCHPPYPGIHPPPPHHLFMSFTLFLAPPTAAAATAVAIAREASRGATVRALGRRRCRRLRHRRRFAKKILRLLAPPDSERACLCVCACCPCDSHLEIRDTASLPQLPRLHPSHTSARTNINGSHCVLPCARAASLMTTNQPQPHFHPP